MPQSEPAGQEQMASVQQARRLWVLSLAPIGWSRKRSLEQFTPTPLVRLIHALTLLWLYSAER